MPVLTVGMTGSGPRMRDGWNYMLGWMSYSKDEWYIDIGIGASYNIYLGTIGRDPE